MTFYVDAKPSHQCRLCEQRGKTWNGDDPRCAFIDGTFVPNNWNCATMNELRNIAHKMKTGMRDDNSAGSIGYVLVDADWADDFDVSGGYIVMTWYKDRGKTSNALFMTDEGAYPLTISLAELAIKTDKIWERIVNERD